MTLELWNATPRFLSSLDMNIRSCTQALEGSLLPSVTRAHTIKEIIRFERNDRTGSEKKINNHSPNNLVLKIVLSVYL